MFEVIRQYMRSELSCVQNDETFAVLSPSYNVRIFVVFQYPEQFSYELICWSLCSRISTADICVSSWLLNVISLVVNVQHVRRGVWLHRVHQSRPALQQVHS